MYSIYELRRFNYNQLIDTIVRLQNDIEKLRLLNNKS